MHTFVSLFTYIVYMLYTIFVKTQYVPFKEIAYYLERSLSFNQLHYT